jgi:hypothetical protein
MSESQNNNKYKHCKGITACGKSCNTYKINEQGYCHAHEYMETYTEEMMNNLKVCKGCRRNVYLSGELTSCEKCANRGKENREKLKQKRKEPENMCLAENCKYKKGENGYCGLHQTIFFVENAKSQGKKCCNRYNHGCKNLLELDYRFTRCEECRIKERINDKILRDKRKNKSEETKTKTEKQCIECTQTFPIQQFMSEETERTRCESCREKAKIYDQRRDKEHRREMGKIYDSKPKRKEMKKEWVQKNLKKVIETSIRSRLKRRKENIHEYLKKQAENAKNWRERHPEKVEEYNKFRNNSIHHSYMSYKRTANYKNLEVDEILTDYPTFEQFVQQCCYYCGSLHQKGFSGIDRKDSTQGYVKSNCVPCCEKCNFMKGCLDPISFYRRICHLISVNEWFENVQIFFYEYFPDHHATAYTDYRARAERKQLEFNITHEKYNELTHSSCYLCRKEASESHLNGMDRYDNCQGYNEDNVLPCCSECNYMKGEITLDDFIEHCIQIYEYITSNQDSFFNENVDIPDCITVLHRCHLNKKTQDEKKETREKLISETTDKYTDDYIQTHAQSLLSNSISNPETDNIHDTQLL